MNSTASWIANATTLATSIPIGPTPYGVFVNTNNTIYVADRGNSRFLVWDKDSINPTRIISGSLTFPMAIFVAITGDIYVDNGNTYGRVDKFTMNTNSSVSAMSTGGQCLGLFIDSANNLYCSLHDVHKVIKQLLGSVSNIMTIIAGIGCSGSTANMLNRPQGIFVDINFDLYVADSGNNRIQLFRPGQLNGITVAGTGSLNVTIALSYPTGVVLDGDGYLFIADNGNSRIVGSGPNGFRCIVGCSSVNGSTADQLSYPATLSFDSFGNIYVADYGNYRVQKFLLLTKSAGKSVNY